MRSQVVVFSIFLSGAAQADGPALQRSPSAAGRPIGAVVLAPPFSLSYTCAEHAEGELEYVGDALGSDCQIVGGVTSRTDGFMRPFRTDGAENEDWYGWGADVLAPFDGIVTRVTINPVVNRPGKTGTPPASMIFFKAADGTEVVFAHIADPVVKAGDRVAAGAVVAKVGNNGFGRNPHLHIGAWRGSEPLQIRWDLRAAAKYID